MRMKFKPWAKEYVQTNREIFVQDNEHLEEYLDGAKIVHLELGSGKGRFIHTIAKNNPGIKYIGIERFDSVIVYAGAKLEEEPLDNLLFWSKDVKDLLEYPRLVGNVDLIYLNFSDPWPKSRHTKRRLTAPSFLSIYDKLLSKDGHIQFKTDNQALFEYSLHSISTFGYAMDNISLDLHNTDRPNVMTEYEEKFSNLGFRINYLEAKRR